MKVFVYIIGFLLLCSCTSNTILEKPKNLIPKHKMAAVLTDLFLATGAKSVKNAEGNRQINYIPLVYEKYQIDSTQFKESNYYYTSLIDVNAAILTIVEKRLNHIKDSLSTIERHLDSIKQKTSKNLRDSLKLLKATPLLKSKAFNKPKRLIDPPILYEKD